MTEYLPKDTAVPSSTSAEDQRYAQAFKDVAEVLRLSDDSERLTLLLSTCRNAYLTVNALFRDVVEVLGHGTHPSLLASTLFLLRQGEYQRAYEPLDLAAAALAIYADKRAVWENRTALKAKLDHTLEEHLDKLARDRFLHLVVNVRTAENERGMTWEPRFYEFSQAEPATLAESLGVLDQTTRVLTAIVAVARAIASLPQEDLLFGSEIESKWLRLRELLVKHSEPLGLSLSTSDGNGLPVIMWPVDGRVLHFPETPGEGMAPALTGIAPLLGRLDERLRAEYEHLSGAFRPNIGQPPLPPPFRIDLTEPQSKDIWWPAPQVEQIRFGREVPATVRIALPLVGIPLAYLNTTQNRYLDQHRPEVERLARTAIEAAGTHRADVIIFPEGLLPRNALDQLADLAAKKNVVLIGGVEGHIGGDALLQNEVLIRFPDNPREFLQSKQMESIYETKLRVHGGVRIFQGTRLGTFAVVICSDTLEWGVLSALASAPTDLHFVFVCAMNPHPELFEHCAIADATRLYCHVVIANNCADTRQRGAATGAGTVVRSPQLQPRVSPTEAAFSLGLPALGGSEPTMEIFDVSVESLLTSRRQRVGGFLPFPASRVRKSINMVRV